MPAILIEHPEHGRTHVYDPQELAAHEARGWAVVPAVVQTTLPAAVYVTPIAAPVARRSRLKPAPSADAESLL